MSPPPNRRTPISTSKMVVVALTAGSKLPGWMGPSTLSFLDGPVGKAPGKPGLFLQTLQQSDGWANSIRGRDDHALQSARSRSSAFFRDRNVKP